MENKIDMIQILKSHFLLRVYHRLRVLLCALILSFGPIHAHRSFSRALVYYSLPSSWIAIWHSKEASKQIKLMNETDPCSCLYVGEHQE